MRDRIWNNLYNIKFKALYTCECSKKAERYGRLYSLFIALTSAGSIATWAIWKEIPYVWAFIIVWKYKGEGINGFLIKDGFLYWQISQDPKVPSMWILTGPLSVYHSKVINTMKNELRQFLEKEK